jgi:putative hydrolase of the HAD superfamily
MPLLMLDLDNTLIDRDAAFRAAASTFLAEHSLPASELAWLTHLDGSGYTPRQEVARVLTDRHPALADAVQAFVVQGTAAHVTLTGPTRRALARARAAGWTCAIVSNGRTAQQEKKIRNTGLDALVHSWAISEAVGHKKPAPEIFHAAAEAAGASLDGAWMVGDAAHSDIRGARAVGARSVWVARGRTWRESAYHPTHITPDTAAAIEHVIRVSD